MLMERSQKTCMRVGINLLTEDPANPSGAHWFWTRVIPETQRLGAFSRDLWVRLLAEAGFEQVAGPGEPLPGRRPDNLFIGRRRR